MHQEPVLLMLYNGPTCWHVEMKANEQFKCYTDKTRPYFHQGKAITNRNITRRRTESHFCRRVLLHITTQTTHVLTWAFGGQWLEGTLSWANIPHVKGQALPVVKTKMWHHSEWVGREREMKAEVLSNILTARKKVYSTFDSGTFSLET